MTTTVCSGRSNSISLPLQLPALIPRGPRCSSSSLMIPKPKHSSPPHPHLSSPALPCTSTITTYLFSCSARTTKKKPILTVTNVNSNTTSGAGASQSQPSSEQVVYQGVYGPWTIQPSDVREVTFSALVSHSSYFNPTYMYNLLPQCPSWFLPGNITNTYTATFSFNICLQTYNLNFFF